MIYRIWCGGGEVKVERMEGRSITLFNVKPAVGFTLPWAGASPCTAVRIKMRRCAPVRTLSEERSWNRENNFSAAFDAAAFCLGFALFGSLRGLLLRSSLRGG